MLNVRLACDHLFGKLLFTWLSLVMSMMVSFVLSFFPRDVLDEILNLIESVSEDFPSYSLLPNSDNVMDGRLEMSGHKIKRLGNPVDSGDAVNKE